MHNIAEYQAILVAVPKRRSRSSRSRRWPENTRRKRRRLSSRSRRAASRTVRALRLLLRSWIGFWEATPNPSGAERVKRPVLRYRQASYPGGRRSIAQGVADELQPADRVVGRGLPAILLTRRKSEGRRRLAALQRLSGVSEPALGSSMGAPLTISRLVGARSEQWDHGARRGCASIGPGDEAMGSFQF
jgi:hypothetical protein